MDSLAALRLQVEWGADEALGDLPRDYFRPAPPPRFVPPSPVDAPLSIPAPVSVPPPGVVPRTVPAVARGTAIAAAAANLAELSAALDAFDGCALRHTATKTVRPDGNPAAKLVLIAEAPAADDDRAGTAFAGVSGQAFDRVLGSAGLGRSQILLSYLVPWRPPGGRAPTEVEIQACLPFVIRLLQLVRPGYLILLGATPARALTGSSDSIRRLRGRWLRAALPGFDASLPALPMLPWDQWLRSPAAKRDSWSDLLALRQAMDSTD